MKRLIAALLLILFAGLFFIPAPGDIDWPVYGGSKANIRYSSLQQVNTSNVHLLEPAWTFTSGDADTVQRSQIQCNPIIVNGILYATSPTLKLLAIHASTGKLQWFFDPTTFPANRKNKFSGVNNSRGVTYWSDGAKDQRIFYGSGSFLYSINAHTGKPVESFGEGGRIDLQKGLDRDATNLLINVTTPGIIYKDLIIVGSRVDEAARAAPGHLRAFNVRTGERQWIFHTIPHPGEAGHETWKDPEAYRRIGGANSWSGLSLDESRGILFVPTGSAAFDFYGGKRLGDNLFANTLLALDAQTGKRIWHFQTVHHDVWDRDLPTAPALVTVTHNGKKIDAVAQPTKSGFIYLFERATGKPLFPIEEKPVPTDTELSGEVLSPTQPFPLLPKPFARQQFRADDLNKLVSDSSQAEIRARWNGFRKDHLFAPPTKQGTIILPGFDGGAEWGGPAFDPQSGLLYVNANEMSWILRMVDQPVQPRTENFAQAGARLYRSYCRSCHGPDREGAGNYPAVNNIQDRYDAASLQTLLRNGRRMMPAFAYLKPQEVEAITDYMLNQTSRAKEVFATLPVDSFLQLPYGMDGYNKFLTREGYPAIDTPWGTLNAINLHTGALAWKVPLGVYPEFEKKGIITGAENYGGPVVTAGGLVFIAATRDSRIRAFDKKTGKQLWSWNLPAPGFATPAVYSSGGRQFIVIACGGGKLGTRSGDTYVAFALPEKK